MIPERLTVFTVDTGEVSRMRNIDVLRFKNAGLVGIRVKDTDKDAGDPSDFYLSITEAEAESLGRDLLGGGSVFVVIVESDRDIYTSDAHATRAGAEEQLAIVRSEWAERYGEDGFDEWETDEDRIQVLDGPQAQLHELAMVNDDTGLIPNMGQEP